MLFASLDIAVHNLETYSKINLTVGKFDTTSQDSQMTRCSGVLNGFLIPIVSNISSGYSFGFKI